MKQNNKNLLYAGIAVIVVIAIALVVPRLHTSNPAVTAPMTNTQTAQVTPVAVGSNPALATWNAMFQKYDGHLVVFAADCTATPIVQDQSKGATILLMNNSNVPHVVTVEKVAYSIGAYHYKSVVLTGTGTTTLKCDARGDAANINIKQ